MLANFAVEMQEVQALNTRSARGSLIHRALEVCRHIVGVVTRRDAVRTLWRTAEGSRVLMVSWRVR